MRICDWFVLIWSQGLVPRTVHTKDFEGQVAGTSPTNLNQFEFVARSRRDQILVPATRFFDKNG